VEPFRKPFAQKRLRMKQTATCREGLVENLGFEEIACVLLFSFFGVSGYIPLLAPNQAVDPAAAASPGSLAMIVGVGTQVVAGLTIILLVLKRFYKVSVSVPAMHWAGLVAILAVVSSAWSQDPSITIRRSIPFLLSTLFAVYFAANFPIRKQLSILWSAMLLLALATIVITVLVPQYGLDASPGHASDWRGVFTQKNACGRAMVFATAITFAMGRPNLTRLLGLSVFLFVLAMSGSRSFWLIELCLIGCATLLSLLKRYDKRSRAVIVAGSLVLAAVVTGLALYYAPLFLTAMGREVTLTGRAGIWREVWHAIAKHPILGYGFSAFWLGLQGESFNVIAALGFVVLHAHNGFLELWLEMGGVGLAFFAISYLRGCRGAWRMISTRHFEQATWPIYVLLLIFLSDIDENTLLIYNGIFWILYVTALVNLEILLSDSLGKAAVKGRAQAEFAASGV
jgi:exopolysaccharide production protein ExoQ